MDEDLLHAGAHQALGFRQHPADGPAGQPAPHRRDDAERALVVAALGDLQVRVVAGGQLDALGRHQVDEGVVGRGDVLVHRAHDLLVGLGTGDTQHVRVFLQDALGPGAQAAGDQHLAVSRHRLADGLEGLVHGLVDEATGVHDHQVGILVGLDRLVALRAQARQEALGVHERLGAAQADESDTCWHAKAVRRFGRAMVARRKGACLPQPERQDAARGVT
jgi:hypothetical protein